MTSDIMDSDYNAMRMRVSRYIGGRVVRCQYPEKLLSFIAA